MVLIIETANRVFLFRDGAALRLIELMELEQRVTVVMVSISQPTGCFLVIILHAGLDIGFLLDRTDVRGAVI